MNVLVVARTMMGDHRCIGAIGDDGRSLRLLTREGYNHFSSASYRVGETWEMDLEFPTGLKPPHVEDARILRERGVGQVPNLRDHLLGRVNPWRGGISGIFDGLLRFTGKGTGFISESTGVPAGSTGFWLSDRPLTRDSDGKTFTYADDRRLSYVGESPSPVVIPAGSLVRVSLARWWKPPNADETFEQRCYLQLSGWYP